MQSIFVLCWLFQTFGMSVSAAAVLFFPSNLLSAHFVSRRAVLWANRIGLVRTMAFTHLPSNLLSCCYSFVSGLPVVIAFDSVRSLLLPDGRARRANSYVMADVTPREHVAAASLTSVPRAWRQPSVRISGLTPHAFGLRLAAADRRPTQERRPSDAARDVQPRPAAGGAVAGAGGPASVKMRSAAVGPAWPSLVAPSSFNAPAFTVAAENARLA